MSKSEENTNELESYGVWVKNTAQAPEDIADSQETTEDSLDLPDFESTDFSDMFKNDSDFEAPETPSAEVDETNTEVDETNMFANGEELSNDSATDEVILHDFPEDGEIKTEDNITDESPAENSVEEESFDIPEIDTSAEIEVPEVEESSFETPAADTDDTATFEGFSEIETNSSASIDNLEINTENVDSNADFEEISFDAIDEPAPEKTAGEAPKAQLAPGEEEVSLDDFLEDGFSDDSVASGNNGYEPGKGPDAEKAASPAPAASEGGTEDISLDDFMDGGDFGVEMTETSASEAAADETPDEPPLEMDISFDDSTDTIQTEDNKVSDDFTDFTADDSEDFETETSSEPVAEAKEEVYVADTSNVSTEEVDLSDFGIDSDAEETPVTQNVEEKKAAETVIDYDLAIGDEDSLASAPVINEIKSDDEEKPEAEETVQPVQASQPDPTTTSLLQQIVAELSGLKNDINKLKSEIDEVKEREAKGVQQVLEVEDEISLESEAADTDKDLSIETDTEDQGGFFSADEDETIALSADELTNIPIDTDSVIEAESEVPIDDPVAENFDAPAEEAAENTFEEIKEDSLDQTFDIPSEDSIESSIEESIESPADDVFENPSEAEDTGFFTDEGDDTIALSGDELSNIMNTTEISESDGISEEAPIETDIKEQVTDETVIENTSIEEPAVEEPVIEEPLVEEETVQVEAEEAVTEEPVADEPVFTAEEDIFEPAPFEAEETAVSDSEVEEESFEEPLLSDNSDESSVDSSDDTIEDSTEDLNFDFEDKNLEEPDIDNIHLDDMSDSDLPEEISIPKTEENIFVESTSSDFMDSINSVSEDTTAEITDNSNDVNFETTDSIFSEDDEKDSVEFDSTDTLFEEHFDTTETILADTETTTEEAEAPEAVQAEETAPVPQNEAVSESASTDSVPEETVTSEAAPTEEAVEEEKNDLEDVFSEAASEIFDDVDTSIEPVAEEAVVENTEMPLEESSVEVSEVSSAEDSQVEEESEDNEVPTVDKIISQSNEAAIDSNFAEVDNLDTAISKDNIDYLNSDKEASGVSNTTSNEDLKRDIKSVLLYMDQLLENLPEEKIMEFAKSDEFVTYKKLFSDLGLS